VITYVRRLSFTGLAAYILNLSGDLMLVSTGLLIDMLFAFTIAMNIGRRKYRVAHLITDFGIVLYTTIFLMFLASGMAVTAVVIQFFNGLGLWILSTPIIIHTRELLN